MGIYKRELKLGDLILPFKNLHEPLTKPQNKCLCKRIAALVGAQKLIYLSTPKLRFLASYAPPALHPILGDLFRWLPQSNL